jgi:hypothetical protein
MFLLYMTKTMGRIPEEVVHGDMIIRKEKKVADMEIWVRICMGASSPSRL